MKANMGFPLEGKPNQGWKLYLASLVMVLGAGLIVVARIVTRLRMGRLMADDYTIIASLVFSIVLSVNIQLAVVHGYGKHKSDLSLEDLQTCLKFFWIAQTPYKIVVCLNKISLILLYMRIFIAQKFRLLCYIALAIVVSSGMSTVFATIFECVPLERSWNKAIDGTCIDSSKFWLANAILNISTDVIVLALPIHEVFKLQLKLQERILLHSVFLLGGFVTITSILRVTAVANSSRNQQDQTWNFIPRGVWTLVEANLGIICACLVVLNQVVRRFFSSLFGGSKAESVGTRGYGYGSGAVAGSTKQDVSSRRTQQHLKLDDTIDDEDMDPDIHQQRCKPSAEGTWKNVRSYGMKSVAYRGASNERRKSDEKHIMSSRDTKEDRCQSSVESVDLDSKWPLDPVLRITKKVDVQVTSTPSSSAGS